MYCKIVIDFKKFLSRYRIRNKIPEYPIVKYLILHWALATGGFAVELLNSHWKQLYTLIAVGLDFDSAASKSALYLHIKVTAW